MFSYSLESGKQYTQLIKLGLDNVEELSEDFSCSGFDILESSFDDLIELGLDINKISQLLFSVYFSRASDGKVDEDKMERYNKLLLKALQHGLDLKTADFALLQNLSLSSIKLLLEHGLEPMFLTIADVSNSEEVNELLDLMEEYNIEVSPVTMLSMLMNLEFELDIDLIRRVFDNLSFKLDENLDAQQLIERFSSFGPQFQAYIDKMNAKVNVVQVLKTEFCHNGSLLHFLAKANKMEILSFIFASNYPHNINGVNELGQNALFYAASPSIADLLIQHGLDVDHLDSRNKKWFYVNPALEMIGYAIQNRVIDNEETGYFIRQFMLEGNFEHAAKVAKLSFSESFNLVNAIRDVIMAGLENSIENNKYQALLHLVNNAGIAIPEQYQHLLKNVKDDVDVKEYDFLYGLLHKLAKHYLHLVKAEFVATLASEGYEGDEVVSAVNNFFVTLDHHPLKELCASSLLVSKITDEFSANAVVLSKASSLLDHDFTYEAIVINGLGAALVDINNSQPFYRGMKLTLSEDDVDSYFKYGHQAFVSSEKRHKLLGFNINQRWNEIKNAHWEYGGTYLSLDPLYAAEFASGLTSSNKAANSLLIESRF